MAKKSKDKKEFPKKFPFWARMRIEKQRTTLVIDEEVAENKRTKKVEDHFEHREATHTARKGAELIEPNPDRTDNRPMHLKAATRHPKRLFEPHNKKLSMPKHLRERYDKNNKKGK